MNQPGTERGELLVAFRGEAAVVRVVGRGNHINAAALRQLGGVVHDKGTRHLVLDGVECTAMDSTFLGTIVGLAAAYKRAGGRLSAVRISTRLRKTFATLGVDRVVDIISDPGELPDGLLDSGPNDGTETAGAAPDAADLARVMLDAHEALSGLSDANRAEFREVLDFLREEMERQQAPPSRTGNA